MDFSERLHLLSRPGVATLLTCWVILFFPTYYDLWQGMWRSSDQSQGPIVLAIAVWLLWQKLHSPAMPAPATQGSALGWTVFGLGLLMYMFGRSQEVLLFEVGAQIPVIGGVLMVVYGRNVLRLLWFPLLFLLFMVPLPGGVVDALTMPMKIAVSWTVENVLYGIGYPVARTGVMIQVGQYKLLVADACAGLHTLFTLESLGLLYLHLVRRESWFRNISLAILVIPIAFIANSIRVACLVLVTYYFGDEAGQGFLHDFAGLVLFVSAFLIILCADGLLTFVSRMRPLRGGVVHA
jgi:exosortase B